MSGAASARLFIASEIPEAFKTACSELRAGHGAELRSARWTRPEGIHLTFKFLGETAEARIPAIGDALALACRQEPPFQLVTGEAGFFGSPARPRVLWAALGGDTEAASRLAGRIEAALEPLGFAREERPFRPHLTLARLDPSRRGPIPQALLDAAGRRLAGIVFEVREAILFQSLLERGGARYIPRARFPLEGSP